MCVSHHFGILLYLRWGVRRVMAKGMQRVRKLQCHEFLQNELRDLSFLKLVTNWDFNKNLL